MLSNEWVNIWTHLAGAIVSLGVLWHDLTVFYPAVALQHPERGSGDAITATFYLLCILVQDQNAKKQRLLQQHFVTPEQRAKSLISFCYFSFLL